MAEKWEAELRTAIEAVWQAGKICRAVQSESIGDVLEKSDRSPVTIADFSSQAIICHLINSSFPDDPIIGEEDSAELREPENLALKAKVCDYVGRVFPRATADDICRWIDLGNASSYSSRFWTLDPIDGTKGFLRGEQYAVSLSLIEDGEVVVAALACPNLPVRPGTDLRDGSIFFAVRGQGAFVRSFEAPKNPIPIRVNATSDPRQMRFCESVESAHSSHSDAARIAQHLGITAQPIRIDSQAKYAVVARGEADIYLRLPTRKGYREKIWDHAAGYLIIVEAGGRVTDIHGKAIDFSQGRELSANRGIIATNGIIHDRVLEALQLVGVA